MSNNDTSALLRIEDLSVRFATARGSLQALDRVSLDVARSRTLAIVGESGSGKSVLSRSILRLLPPTAQLSSSARIQFDGADLLRLERHAMQRVRGRRIAMVFQDPMTALNPVRRIGSQMIEGMRRHLGLSTAQAEHQAIELLAQVGITSPSRRMQQYPHELSGGMRQRVVIAMAIACKPDLLIADEPTTALDVTVQAEILELLQRLQRERNMTMILITHDLGVAASYADDIAVMYAGQVVEKAQTQTLFLQPRMPYTRALLQSIPTLRSEPHAPLFTIPGRPPTIYGEHGGCRFAARCDRSADKCRAEAPALVDTRARHAYRCWFPLEAA
jgi:oligopeptide/dipeptide ABC transporter ATP-binding protein